MESAFSFPFGVVDQLEKRELNPNSYFGLHMNGNKYLESLKLASKIGFTWTRGGLYHNSWRVMQPSKNRFNQQVLEKNKTLIKYHKNLGMTPITILGVHTPNWASNAPVGSKEYHLYPPRNENLKDYSKYVKKLVSEYGDSIFAYEVWNEPNTSVFYRGTPEQFSNILTSSFSSVKSVNPQAKKLLLSA